MKSLNCARIIVVIVLMFTFAFAADVEVIAVHFGNPEYAEVLNKADYPGFNFYVTDGSTYSYVQDQKLIGNPNFLGGFYGEVPEKMGFSANYTTEKSRSGSYRYGKVYVVGKNGLIAAETPENAKFSDDGYIEDYTTTYDLLRSSIKQQLKGKYAKPAKNMAYLKSTPSGELELFTKAKIDKAGKGIVGWPVPDITVYDEAGEPHKLNELTADKNCVVVFYTMNAVLHKYGDMKDGSVYEEKYMDMPANKVKEAEKDIQSAQTPGELFKTMAKQALSDDDNTYGKYTDVLFMVKRVLDNIK